MLGATGRGQIEEGPRPLAEDGRRDAGQRAAQHPAVVVEERDRGQRPRAHVAEHVAEGGRNQDPAHHAIAVQDGTGGGDRGRRGAEEADVLVSQRVVAAVEDGLHEGIAGEVASLTEDQAAGVGGVGLVDLQDGTPAGVEDLDRSQPVVDLQGNDQPAQGRLVRGGHRRPHAFGVGDQADGGQLLALHVHRLVQGGVLRHHQLVADAPFQRAGHETGREVGSDHSQDDHEEEERQDDLGPDAQRGDADRGGQSHLSGTSRTGPERSRPG